MTGATTGRAVITSGHNQYYFLGIGCWPDDEVLGPRYEGHQGLISHVDSFAIIFTGTDTGPAEVTVQWCEEPAALELDQWDEVVEVSMGFTTDAMVYDPHADPIVEPGPPDLIIGPARDENDPLWFRVRVHARGRDAGSARDFSDDPPDEFHLIQAWPVPRAPEIQHKLSGQIR